MSEKSIWQQAIIRLFCIFEGVELMDMSGLVWVLFTDF